MTVSRPKKLKYEAEDLFLTFGGGKIAYLAANQNIGKHSKAQHTQVMTFDVCLNYLIQLS